MQCSSLAFVIVRERERHRERTRWPWIRCTEWESLLMWVSFSQMQSACLWIKHCMLLDSSDEWESFLCFRDRRTVVHEAPCLMYRMQHFSQMFFWNGDKKNVMHNKNIHSWRCSLLHSETTNQKWNCAPSSTLSSLWEYFSKMLDHAEVLSLF